MGWLCCVLLMVTCGCEPFRQSQYTYQPPSLPASRLSLDAVGLEIGIAQIDTGQKEAIKRFWRDLDQQELSLETRQKLDKHGLKAAVMSQQPPSDFGNLVKFRLRYSIRHSAGPLKLQQLSAAKQIKRKNLTTTFAAYWRFEPTLKATARST